MKLPIAYYGAPILRRKAALVGEIDNDIRQLISDMEETMHAYHGVGLAAPQVHRSLALFIICPQLEGVDEKTSERKIQVFINPKLSHPSHSLIEKEEGCLSIPSLYAPVIRPDSIIVEALNEEGHPFKLTFSGMEARIIMHENDHINGVLFIDRLNNPKLRKKIEPLLRTVKEQHLFHKA